MPTYVYKAMNKKGQESTGEIEAASHEQAIKQIQKRGLFPTDVKTKRDKGLKRAATTAIIKVKRSAGLGGMGGSVSSKILANFTRQLSTLQDAGLPLVRSLQILANQEKNSTMQVAISKVVEEIQGGSNLSDALRKHPKVFDRLYVNMVRAGEAGGILDVILNRLTDFMEKAEKLKREVKGALVYPVTVTIFATLIVSFIMIFIIPEFEKMFDSIDGDLPLPTQILQGISRFMIGGGWAFLILIPVGLWIGMTLIKKNEAGRFLLDKTMMRIPLFGAIIKKSTISRFCRTLGTLQSSGVPLLEALSIVKSAAGNSVVERAISDVHDSIREGDSIAEPLGNSGLFEPMIINMVEVGEETGELDKMLIKVADNYDSDVEALVAGLMNAFEPILIIGMGAVVGGIVVALFLPMISIIKELQ